MGVDDLPRTRQDAVAPKRFIGTSDRGQAIPTAQPPAPPGQCIRAAAGAQVAQQIGKGPVGHGQRFAVEYRIAKPRGHQGVTQALDAGKRMNRVFRADLRERVAQFVQGVRAEHRKQQQPAGSEHTPKPLEHARKVGNVMQTEIGHDQINTALGKRKGAGIGADPIEVGPATPPAAGPGLGEHGRRPVDGQHAGTRPSAGERIRDVAGAAAYVQCHGRLSVVQIAQ